MANLSQHEEWLSLVDTRGPFLSSPVLGRVFPHGLDVIASQKRAELRAAYEEWATAISKGDNRYQEAWIEFVLGTILEFPDRVMKTGDNVPESAIVDVLEHGTQLRPDAVIVNPDDSSLRMLINVLSPGTSIDEPIVGTAWQATSIERMTVACRELDVRIGLITNGEEWVLINAPRGENEGATIWTAAMWLEEPLTFRAFSSLLGVRRFFSSAQSDTLEAMLKDSIEHQAEVTERLGEQVRGAVEVLVQALDSADADSGRVLLKKVPEQQLYEAAVTVMMRLVFLFNAEERGLLPLGEEFYDSTYAASPLLGILRGEADRIGEEVLERREDAWARVMAVSRAVFGGVKHDRLSLVGYGGSLFDPDRYPFLEGRSAGTKWTDDPAEPLRIDNRTVLHLLESLQLLKIRGGEPRRLSFRALDVEQIGHVYEGLLDHTAIRVTEPYLGLQAAKGMSAEVSLSDLESAEQQGKDKILEFLSNKTGRSSSAVTRGLSTTIGEIERAKLRVSCGNDSELLSRVEPYASLLRDHPRGYPAVFPAESLIVTAGLDRRSTQTHYTQRSLTEEVVQYALEPIVFEGPAEGKPKTEWRLKSPRQLLDLKICDPTMGSGAFLVQVIRWLGERVTEAWGAVDDSIKPIDIYGEEVVDASQGGIPRSTEERIVLARRLIAERCIYGVDINPFAVEMAKMSIWLVTMSKNKPFGFLDHALKVGDTMLGVVELDQISHFHLNSERGKVLHNKLPDYTHDIEPAVNQAMSYRDDLRNFEEANVEDLDLKAEFQAEADKSIYNLRLAADAVVAASLGSESNPVKTERKLVQLSVDLPGLLSDSQVSADALARKSNTLLNEGKPESRSERRPFHWPLEFPEVFLRDNPGFDVIVVNPPFLGGQRITSTLGTNYREYLVTVFGGGERGSADLSAYFIHRFAELLRRTGVLATLSTNSIAQGVTERIGLSRLLDQTSGEIYRAISSRPWPGAANLEIAIVWIFFGRWDGKSFLDDEPSVGITSSLSEPSRVNTEPQLLAENSGQSFQGSNVLGKGFILDESEVEQLIQLDRENRDVIFPYLNGKDLNTSPTQTASRHVIWFKDRDVISAAKYEKPFERVELLVKPNRINNKMKSRAINWWKFGVDAKRLYAAIESNKHVLVKTQVSSTWAWVFVNPGQVYDQRLTIFSTEDWGEYGVLQSFVHREWMWRFSTTLKTDDVYTPTHCFENYPRPKKFSDVRLMGEKFHNTRNELSKKSGIGLTKIYRRFDDPEDTSAEISELRSLQRDLDGAVLKSYGWVDLNPEYVFRTVREKRRYCLDETMATEIVDRLLELNHERHAAEEYSHGSSAHHATQQVLI
jgi:hypothetical protein